MSIFFFFFLNLNMSTKVTTGRGKRIRIIFCVYLVLFPRSKTRSRTGFHDPTADVDSTTWAAPIGWNLLRSGRVREVHARRQPSVPSRCRFPPSIKAGRLLCALKQVVVFDSFSFSLFGRQEASSKKSCGNSTAASSIGFSFRSIWSQNDLFAHSSSVFDRLSSFSCSSSCRPVELLLPIVFWVLCCWFRRLCLLLGLEFFFVSAPFISGETRWGLRSQGCLADSSRRRRWGFWW